MAASKSASASASALKSASARRNSRRFGASRSLWFGEDRLAGPLAGIGDALRVRDTIMYNVMIAGCAHHGFEHEAIRLFEEMVGWGLHPVAITFIALLSACRHSGLVEAGESYFLSMSRDYGIQPEMNHYACMIDLYGRADLLEKTVKFMEEMPIEHDSVVLSAFLTGRRASKNIELTRMAEKKLVEIEGDEGSRLFQLASIYAPGGEWEEKDRMMRRMRGKEAKKVAGCSWIQVGGGVHSFRSSDKSHVAGREDKPCLPP